MSTAWCGEGNIGQVPEFKVVKTGSGDRTLLECSVYFDNPVPTGENGFADRGGFWATVEWWHQNAEAFSKIYQKGMRVLVPGTLIMDTYQSEGEDRARMKVRAERIALLPYRIESVTMSPPRVRESQHA